MGSRVDIINEMKDVQTPQDFVRRKYLKKLSEYTKRDTILYAVEYPCKKPGASAATSVIQDDIQGFMSSLNRLKGDKLDLIIQSPGGSLEAAEQIVHYLRSKYNHIRAIIPQCAMSAASMIACACDEIIMGKQSAIGPIDPQMGVPSSNGVSYMPAHAILADFETAKREVSADPRLAPIWVPKIMSLPAGYLDLCQKTIELSQSKVSDWLNTYMFSNSDKKGKEIAEWLGDFTQHKTHGRPIGFELARQHGLKVQLMEDDQVLQDLILSVYHAYQYTFEISPCVKIIENQNGIGQYVILNLPK